MSLAAVWVGETDDGARGRAVGLMPNVAGLILRPGRYSLEGFLFCFLERCSCLW